ncbi:MAG: hypothetical protein KDB61_09545, partial [Planctomycetes bacterium]|nr:hypothetical protein [Planctomycetota bacterium]
EPWILQVQRAALEPGGIVRGEVLRGASAEAVAQLRVLNGRGGVVEVDGTRFVLRGVRPVAPRSEVRRGGEECRSRRSPDF